MRNGELKTMMLGEKEWKILYFVLKELLVVNYYQEMIIKNVNYKIAC
jgi:hypothetical protein